MGVYRKYNNELQSVAGANASGLPIGAYVAFEGEGPTGWLKCDGSTFDKDLYPELYLYLSGSDTLPIMNTSNETVLWTGTNFTASNGTITLPNNQTLFDYDRIRFEGGNVASGNTFKCPSAIFEKDALEDAVRGTSHRLFFDWYAGEYRYYTISGDGTQIIGADGSGNWNGIMRIVGIKDTPMYIKATTGFTELETTEIYNNIIQYIENHAISNTFPGYTFKDISTINETNRLVEIDTDLLTDGTEVFWKELEDVTVGVWNVINKGSKSIYLRRYGGYGSSSKNNNHPYQRLLAPNEQISFTVVADDPYTDLNSFALEGFLAK